MSEIRTAVLAAPVEAVFHGMTYPVYRHLLALQPAPRHPEQGETVCVEPLAIGAWIGGLPVGLLLAETPLAQPPAAAARAPELLSIFVQPEVRRQGVARALLHALQQELAARGFDAVEAVYTTGRTYSAAVERLLAGAGWSAPATRTVLVHLAPAELAASPLFDERRLQQLDPGFEIFPWAEVGAAERAALIESDARKPWVTPGLAIWKYDAAPFDPAASVGARYRGEVVGWVLAQQIDARAVRYLASFLRKDLSRRGRILPLYRDSLLRAAAAGRELATFVTPVIYPSMIRFIHKWMAPHARLVAETRGSARALPGAAVARMAPGRAP